MIFCAPQQASLDLVDKSQHVSSHAQHAGQVTGCSSEDVNACVSSGGFLTSSACAVSFASIVG